MSHRDHASALESDARAQQRALARLRRMTADELFQLAVRAGIYTPDGELAAPYRGGRRRNGRRV